MLLIYYNNLIKENMFLEVECMKKKNSVLNRKIIMVLCLFIIAMLCTIPENTAFAEEKDLDVTNLEEAIPEEAKLVSVEYLGDGMVVRTYVYEDNNNIVGRAVYARQVIKYDEFEHDGTISVIVKVAAGFSYGYSDGNARATTLTYDVIREYTGYRASGFATYLSNGNPAYAKLTYYISCTNHDAIELFDRTISFSCNNNGTTQ